MALVNILLRPKPSSVVARLKHILDNSQKGVAICRRFKSNAFAMEDLVKARVHLGHAPGVNNPKMKDFIFEQRHGLSIIDLDKTIPLLERALDVTKEIASRGGMVLFVGTRPQMEKKLRRTAISCGEYFVSKKWIGGSLTNTYRVLGGTQLPDLVIFFSLPVNQIALKEVTNCMIPTIGLIDTDCDPTSVDYPVPANDDTPSSVELMLELFARSIMDGKQLLSQHPERNMRFNFEDYRQQVLAAKTATQSRHQDEDPNSSQKRGKKTGHRRDLTRMKTLNPAFIEQARQLARKDARGNLDVQYTTETLGLESAKSSGDTKAHDVVIPTS